MDKLWGPVLINVNVIDLLSIPEGQALQRWFQNSAIKTDLKRCKNGAIKMELVSKRRYQNRVGVKAALSK